MTDIILLQQWKENLVVKKNSLQTFIQGIVVQYLSTRTYYLQVFVGFIVSFVDYNIWWNLVDLQISAYLFYHVSSNTLPISASYVVGSTSPTSSHLWSRSLTMPDPDMTDRTEDNILRTGLTAGTTKGVHTVINIWHLFFHFQFHASVAVLASCCITYSRRFWLLSEIIHLSLQYSNWNVSFNFQSRILKSYLECHHSLIYNFQTPRLVTIPF